MTATNAETPAIDHPHIISGPWTDEARTRAIQDEVREAYIS